MPRRYQVALLIEASNAYARGLLEGIATYVRQHQSWSIYLPEQGRGDDPPPSFARWRGDGVIARIESTAVAAAVKKLRLPTIDVSAARRVPSIPWVETDDEAIAQLAIDHFLSRGFRHLAYCGDPQFNWSRWRCQHFQRIAADAGIACHLFGVDDPLPKSWQTDHRHLVDWVRTLPRPVGIFACYDIRAQQLLDACRDVDAAVPDEVAVLGVDDDPVLCELSEPPLSSIIPDARGAGYRAAELLDCWMRGDVQEPVVLRIPPRGVCTRQSTDVLAIDDADVVAAVRHIREHACEGLAVPDLLKEIPLSRRVLERRFLKAVGHSPHAEILRVRLGRVKHLLMESNLSIEAIAARTGFPHPEYLSVAFKREVGIGPNAFRLQHVGRSVR